MNTIDILSIHEIIIRENNSLQETYSFSETLNDDSMEKWKLIYEKIAENNSSEDVLTDVKAKFNQNEKEKLDNFNYYLVSVVPILDEFVKCKSALQKVSFFKTMNNSLLENKKKIEHVINRYITTVEHYFPKVYSSYWKIESDLYQKRKKVKINGVKECTNCLTGSENFVMSDNHFVCAICGTVISITNDNLISFRDIERINIGSKYTYDRKTHFRECVKRFQGKQNVNIPAKLFEDVINQLVGYQLIPADYRDFPKTKVFQSVKREHIQMILKDLQYSKHYEDIVYIYHKITGHDIPDITHLENNLLNDFDALLECYDQTFKTDRKNFINNQYVLYQLLRKYKYHCRKEDFQFLKTNDRKYYHDVVCQKLFEKLGWNFNPVF